jgi:diaminohydroxyphosphoribosylaminopyrimidine deaminase / 5-amino-6-(5-phosphoribosylamino)uracil reductase
MSPQDAGYLERCLELAELGARTVAPNPMVGCVLVRDGAVIGEGWHQRPGSPHAEVNALVAAGDASGATAYVSLEPCAHHGRTPPCSDALIAAGVVRVVIASIDPDPRTNGQGIERLRAGGVDVELATGDIERRARRQNAGFRTLVRLGRPHVTYKAAVSIDGRVAAPGGEPRWISSPQSRALVHEWRARSGAVAIGIGTALADDPTLSARDCVPPAEHQPLRVVFDRAARLPVGSALVRSVGEGPVAVVCRPGAPGIPALIAAGVEVIEANDAGQALAELGRRRVSTMLLEGGPTLAAALRGEDLVDRLALFVAPLVLGGGPNALEGWPAMRLGEGELELSSSPVGPDTLLVADVHEV